MTDPWPIDLCHPSKFNFLVGREIGTGTFNTSQSPVAVLFGGGNTLALY